MAKIIKNVDTVDHTYAGQGIIAGGSYTLQAIDEVNMSNSDDLLADIIAGKAVINNGTADIVGSANQINYLKSSFQNVSILSQPAQNTFTSKTIIANGVSKSLFRRVTGVTSTLAVGVNTILFTVPYNWTKITGAQMIGGEIGDTANFMVLDSATGAYYGTPNAQLNQFGFNVNIAKDFFDSRSQFDADLYIGMQIKIVYTSISAKNIGINLILDEVK